MLFLKFSTLISTEKPQSHFFTVTETLNSDKPDSNQCHSKSESATAHCSHSAVVSTFHIVQSMNVLQFNHKT